MHFYDLEGQQKRRKLILDTLKNSSADIAIIDVYITLVRGELFDRIS